MEGLTFVLGTFLFIGYVFATTAILGKVLSKSKVDQEMRDFEEFLTK